MGNWSNPQAIQIAVVLASIIGTASVWTAVQTFNSGINIGADNINHNNTQGFSFNPSNTLGLSLNTTGNTFWNHIQTTGNTTRSPFGLTAQANLPSNNVRGDLFMKTNGAFEFYSGGAWNVVVSTNNANTFTNTNSFFGLVNHHLASNYTNPANKTATVSLSPVMLGANATLTPTYNDNATVTVTGTVTDSLGSDGCRVAIQQYSGTSFGNGRAVVAGNEKGANLRIITPAAASSTTPFYQHFEAKSLSAGTKYFFDLDFAAITGGTCTVNNVSWNILEHVQ